MSRRKVKTQAQKLEAFAYAAVFFNDPAARIEFHGLLSAYPKLRIDVPGYALHLIEREKARR